MNNNLVQFFKRYVGKPIPNNPSPMSSWLAGIIREVAENHIAVEFTVRPEMVNPYKTLHGGAIALMIDETIGENVFLLQTDKVYVSVNLQVDFIRPAHLNEKILAKSHIVRKGSTIVHAECHLYNQNHELIAKGTSNLVKTAMNKTTLF